MHDPGEKTYRSERGGQAESAESSEACGPACRGTEHARRKLHVVELVAARDLLVKEGPKKAVGRALEGATPKAVTHARDNELDDIADQGVVPSHCRRDRRDAPRGGYGSDPGAVGAVSGPQEGR